MRNFVTKKYNGEQLEKVPSVDMASTHMSNATEERKKSVYPLLSSSQPPSREVRTRTQSGSLKSGLFVALPLTRKSLTAETMEKLAFLTRSLTCA